MYLISPVHFDARIQSQSPDYRSTPGGFAPITCLHWVVSLRYVLMIEKSTGTEIFRFFGLAECCLVMCDTFSTGQNYFA